MEFRTTFIRTISGSDRLQGPAALITCGDPAANTIPKPALRGCAIWLGSDLYASDLYAEMVVLIKSQTSCFHRKNLLEEGSAILTLPQMHSNVDGTGREDYSSLVVLEAQAIMAEKQGCKEDSKAAARKELSCSPESQWLPHWLACWRPDHSQLPSPAGLITHNYPPLPDILWQPSYVHMGAAIFDHMKAGAAAMCSFGPTAARLLPGEPRRPPARPPPPPPNLQNARLAAPEACLCRSTAMAQTLSWQRELSVLLAQSPPQTPRVPPPVSPAGPIEEEEQEEVEKEEETEEEKKEKQLIQQRTDANFRMFHSITGLYPLHTRSNLKSCQSKMSPDTCHMFPETCWYWLPYGTQDPGFPLASSRHPGPGLPSQPQLHPDGRKDIWKRSGGAGLGVAGVADWAGRTLSSRHQRQLKLSVCAMAVLRHRRGLWGSELTSHRGPSKAGELGACPLRHQAFQKPLVGRRLLKGLVHQRTGTQLPRDRKQKHQAFQKPPRRWRLLKGLVHQRSKAKAWELGACPFRHQAFQKPSPHWRLPKGLVHQRTDTQLPCDRKQKSGSWVPVRSGTRLPRDRKRKRDYSSHEDRRETVQRWKTLTTPCHTSSQQLCVTAGCPGPNQRGGSQPAASPFPWLALDAISDTEATERHRPYITSAGRSYGNKSLRSSRFKGNGMINWSEAGSRQSDILSTAAEVGKAPATAAAFTSHELGFWLNGWNFITVISSLLGLT
ncbi:hypothetical protein QTO34_007651, partial [Cnephaeus nilssonii]